MTLSPVRPASPAPAQDEPTDDELVARIRDGEHPCFELLMRRYNARLYRAARSIVSDADEAEDVVQQAYVSAFRSLHQYNGEARLSTWLTRIAVHEALSRVRRKRRLDETADPNETRGKEAMSSDFGANDPERRAAARQLGRLLEAAIDKLPQSYRAVLMLRDVEHMSTTETAAALDLTEHNVRVRLHRARARLRQTLADEVGAHASEPFPFAGQRCDRIVATVLQRIG